MYSIRNPVPASNKKSFRAKKEAKILATTSKQQQQAKEGSQQVPKEKPPAVIEERLPTVGIEGEAPHPVVETSVKIINVPKKAQKSKAARTLGQALREHLIPLEYVRRLNNSYADKILKGYGMETQGYDLSAKQKMVLDRQHYLHKKGKLLQWHSFRLHYFPNRRIRLCQAFVPEAHKMIQEARPPPPSEAKRKTYTRYASPSFVEPPSSTESTRMVSMFTSPGSTPNKVPLFPEEPPTSASKPVTAATTTTTATATTTATTATMEEQEENEPSSFTVSDVDEQDVETQQQFMVGEDADFNEDEENNYFRTPDRADQGGFYQEEDGDDELLVEDPIVARLNTLESLMIELGVKVEHVVLELKNSNRISAGRVGVMHHKKRKQFQ